jgi:hypothetical protein
VCSSDLSALLSTPLFHGMSGLLFNGEVGLLIFTPWVLLVLICFPSFVRAHLPESVLCGTIFLFNFLFFAKFDSWHGGWVAGPRMLTPTLPFLVIVIVPIIERLQHPGAFGRWPRAALRSLSMALLGAGFLIQVVGGLFPEDRYYALMEFYKDKPAKPWWAGSIPLASIDFLSQMTAAKAQSGRRAEYTHPDQLEVQREEERAYLSMSTAPNEEDFLHSFPNSENMTSPNLMLLKMRLLGLSALPIYGYIISVVFLGLIGLMGLKRYAASVCGE